MEPLLPEFVLIAELFAPLSGAGSFGLSDDAAVIAPRAGFDLVVTTDTIMAGVDFFEDDPPDTVAKKALRVNLSDLGAKGAAPHAYLLNLSLPSAARGWLEAFARGLGEDQKFFGIALLGGDTGAGPLSITVTAFGYVPVGTMIRRSGARSGDAVYVTGAIGDSGGGLAIVRREKHSLNDAQRDRLIARYRVPAPPVTFGAKLRGLASSSIDVSDGLIADLCHVAENSGVRIVLDGEAIPRSDAVRALWGSGTKAILRAATAGDDYQIAFTAHPSLDLKIMREAERSGTAVTCIGHVEEGSGIGLMVDGAAIAVPHPGYRHF